MYRRRVHRWINVAFVVVLVAAVTQVSSAQAHFFGVTGSTSCSLGNKADSATHTYYKSSLTADVSSAVTWAMTNTFNNTPIQPVHLAVPSSFTDVMFYDYNVTTYCGLDWDDPANKVHGFARCATLKSNSRCEKATVRIDETSVNDSRMTLKKLRTLLCHEIGHTLGLKHYGTTASCMNTGLWGNNNKKYYGSHMKQTHLSAEY